MKIGFIFSFLLLSLACSNKPELPSGDLVGRDITSANVEKVPDTLLSAPEQDVDTMLYNHIVLDLVHQNPSADWPVKTVYPLYGAILPFKRIVAFYGNLYSAGMGILGSLPPDEMLNLLEEEVKNWEEADSSTSVIPALHYVAVTAQPAPGPGKRYNLRMPQQQIEKVLELANKVGAIVFLDIQVGHSTLEQELPLLEPFFKMPQVHLGIDPEYSMKNGEIPCARVGTMDAADINYATDYLSGLVRQYHLPPKILIVHRFTKGMVTNYKKINTCPEVQIVMNMDGFGFPAKKISTYKNCIENEPVQFTGFKLFYKQDIEEKKWPHIMTPAEILALYPKPVYIQYQ